MVEIVKTMLETFDTLPRQEQEQLVREVSDAVDLMKGRLNGGAASDWNEGPLTEDDYTAMADEVFQMYDERERQHGAPEAG